MWKNFIWFPWCEEVCTRDVIINCNTKPARCADDLIVTHTHVKQLPVALQWKQKRTSWKKIERFNARAEAWSKTWSRASACSYQINCDFDNFQKIKKTFLKVHLQWCQRNVCKFLVHIPESLSLNVASILVQIDTIALNNCFKNGCNCIWFCQQSGNVSLMQLRMPKKFLTSYSTGTVAFWARFKNSFTSKHENLFLFIHYICLNAWRNLKRSKGKVK